MREYISTIKITFKMIGFITGRQTKKTLQIYIQYELSCYLEPKEYDIIHSVCVILGILFMYEFDKISKLQLSDSSFRTLAYGLYC